MTRCRLDHRIFNTCIVFLVFRFDKLTFLFSSQRRHFHFCTSPFDHHIEGCLWIGIAANWLYCLFIHRKTSFHQKLVDIFLQRFNGLCICCWFTFRCLSLGFDRKPSTVRHVRDPCSTEDTFAVLQFFRHLLQIMMRSREKCSILIIVTSGTLAPFDQHFAHIGAK